MKNVFTFFVQLYLDGGAEKIHLNGRSVAVFGLYKGALFRNLLNQILIGFLLITQAAHQTAAAAGDLGGVERERLDFRHLCGDGMKVVQELAAAVGAAADSETAQHFGLVPDPDLSQLDAVVQDPSQVLDQRAEIHTSVRGEEESSLAALKIALDIHELHVQMMLLNLLAADVEGGLLALAVDLLRSQIHLGGDPQNPAQRLYDSGVLHGMILPGADGDLHAVGRVDDHVVSNLNLKPGGVKIVRFSAVFKSDANYFGHVFSPILCTVSAGERPRGPDRASAASRLKMCLALTFTFRWSEQRCRSR